MFAVNKIPGPEVNGRKTAVLLFDAPHLAESPLLPSFQTTINEAFSAAHPPLLPSSMLRLVEPEQFARELGAKAFTYALIYEDSDDVLATASGKPFIWKEPELQDPVNKTFAYWTNPVEPNMELWEVKLLVVGSSVQKHGLASMLMGLVEAEMRRRFEERKLADSTVASEGAQDEDANKRRLKIVLQTLWEMNDQFYQKRGWNFRDKVFRPRGFLGSETGFHVAAYEKVHDY